MPHASAARSAPGDPPSDPSPAAVSAGSEGELLRVHRLGRRFGKRWALRDVGFALGRGEVLGLVGPNGSGKSTLLRILAGFLRASEGEARVLGCDPYRERRAVMERARFAFAPPALFEALTAREHLLGLQRLSSSRSVSGADPRTERSRRVDAILERVGLAGRADEPVRVFSFGMRQRLALAQALLPTPELLVLDEPTDGLDPLAVAELRTLLRDLARETGVAILVAGHLMAEMAALADRVLVLVEGRELFQGPPRELSAGSERLRLTVRQADAEPARSRLIDRGLEVAVEPGPVDSELVLAPGALALGEVHRILAEGGIELLQYRVQRASLEAALIERLQSARRGEWPEGAPSGAGESEC